MNTEQITKNITDEERVPQVKKQKDPKKVKAGNALARKLIKQDEDEEISSQGESSTPIDVSTIYNGIQSIAGIVGTGFTLYHGWKFYESYRKPSDSMTSTPKGSQPSLEASTSQAEPVTPKKSSRKSVDF